MVVIIEILSLTFKLMKTAFGQIKSPFVSLIAFAFHIHRVRQNLVRLRSQKILLVEPGSA